MTAAPRKRMAVFKFASCDGCQLTLLDAEDELLSIADQVDLAYFLELTSRPLQGPYDIGLVEGSITTPDDVARIRHVRAQCRFMVTIGACATAGGIQALRNGADHEEFLRVVYARPDYIQSLAKSTAIAAHVSVDFELRGCPIDKGQLLDVIRSLLADCVPRVPRHSVCLDCKRQGNVCITVAQGVPCLGPVTHTGCGAICPSFDRGCYGCFGPATQPNLASLSRQTVANTNDAPGLLQLLQTFNCCAPEFQAEAARLTTARTGER